MLPTKLLCCRDCPVMYHLSSTYTSVTAVLFLVELAAALLLRGMLEESGSESSCERFMVDVEAGKQIFSSPRTLQLTFATVSVGSKCQEPTSSQKSGWELNVRKVFQDQQASWDKVLLIYLRSFQ